VPEPRGSDELTRLELPIGVLRTSTSPELETELKMADTMGSREQLAVAAFANSLLVIPKTLAVNGAYDATELVA